MPPEDKITQKEKAVTAGLLENVKTVDDATGDKKTVVILAEDSSKGRMAWSEFPDQARWWARQNPDYNVIVMPFHKTWEGNTLQDKENEIKELEGNVSVAFMGHSGTTMGGTPLTHAIATNKKRNKQYMELYYGKKTEALSGKVLDGGLRVGAPLTLSDLTDMKGYTGTYTPEYSVSTMVNNLGDKVDDVIVGGCGQGSQHPDAMQGLSSETGKNVYCQYKGSWGTGAIKPTGDEPYEKFFVEDKRPGVGGMVYSPDANPRFIDEGRTEILKEDTPKSIIDKLGHFSAREDNVLRAHLAGYLTEFEHESGEPLSLDELDKKIINLEKEYKDYNLGYIDAESPSYELYMMLQDKSDYGNFPEHIEYKTESLANTRQADVGRGIELARQQVLRGAQRDEDALLLEEAMLEMPGGAEGAEEYEKVPPKVRAKRTNEQVRRALMKLKDIRFEN